MTVKSKIQAAIAAANAKTGESDSTLTDAVQTLIDGYGGTDNFVFATSLNGTFSGAVLPEKMVVYAPSASTISNMFYNSSGCKEVDLTFGTLNTDSVYRLTYGSQIEKITLHGSLETVIVSNSTFYNHELKYILGDPINFSGLTNTAAMFAWDPLLEEVRFVPNTIPFSLAYLYRNPYLSVATLVSIANGLNDELQSTFQFHNTSKNIMSTTHGIVNDDGLFELDDSGTMTITDFITNVKGWTIA